MVGFSGLACLLLVPRFRLHWSLTHFSNIAEEGRTGTYYPPFMRWFRLKQQVVDLKTDKETKSSLKCGSQVNFVELTIAAIKLQH